jgi:hypothetical protein
MAKMKVSESNMQKAVISYFLTNGCCVIRINSGRMTNEISKQYFKAYHVFGLIKPNAGYSDLMVMKDGKTVFIEMKTIDGKQNPNQKAFERHVKNYGFQYEICKSIDDAMIIFKNNF